MPSGHPGIYTSLTDVTLFHADGRFASIIDYHEDRRFTLPKIRRILAS
jgi:hypothetical protein